MAKIILAVTGSISAYKSPSIANALRKSGHEVTIILTEAGKSFVGKLSFSGQGYIVYEDSSEDNYKGVLHVDLANNNDILLIAPASANTIAKIANGMVDNLLTAIVKVCPSKLVIAPAMNTDMWFNWTTIEHIGKLKRHESLFVNPVKKLLACGVEGIGALASINMIVEGVNLKLEGI